MSNVRRRRDRSVSGRKRRAADGTLTYAIRWRDRAGKRCSEKVDGGLKDARKRAAEKQAELNAFGDVRVVTWDDFVKEHLDGLDGKSEQYREDHSRTLTRFKKFAPSFTCDLEVGTVEAFYQERRRSGVSVASANRELRTLKAALTHATKLNYLRENVAKRVDLLKAAMKPRRVLSAEECQKLLAACPDNYLKCFVHVALTSGMRKGELLALQWQDVNLSTGVIGVVSRDGFKTKSRKNRVTSTDAEGLRLLQWIRERHPNAVKVFTDTGKRLTPGRIRKGFADAVTDAKIPECTLHDLRRTSLTLLAAKLPAFALQQRAGHQSPATTAEFYVGSLAEETNRVAGEVFGKVFGPSGPKVDPDNSGA